MSREIKFRVFDKVRKSMSPPFSLFGEFTMLGAVFAWLEHVRGLPECTCGIAQLNEIETAQFTGLRDADGVEIYEGDILHWAGDEKSLKEPFSCAVKYLDDEAKFDFDSVYESDVSWWAGICVVIGNVFEHPHLLDEAK